MPTYEYECETCGKVFERFQNITDAPLTECVSENCKGPVHRLMSGGGGVIFKGAGFHATDYRKGAAAPACASGGCPNAGTCPAAQGD